MDCSADWPNESGAGAGVSYPRDCRSDSRSRPAEGGPLDALSGVQLGIQSVRMEQPLNALVYKRTHRGDPDRLGTFGIRDCMGRVRRWHFDAVIGVGGKSPDRGHEEIARRINWIGITPHKTEVPGLKGPHVKFECFVLLEEDGPDLKELAPRLFKYMFEDQHVRVVLSRSLPDEMQREVQEVLRWAAENNQPGNPPRDFEKKSSTKRRC